MSQADTDQVGFVNLIVHPGGRVIERTTMLERSRKQDGGILLDDGGGRFGMRVNVVRQATFSKLVPQSIGLVRIMVSRQQMPLYGGVSTHSLDDLVARVGRGSCMVIDIARHQYMAHVVLVGEISDARDRIQPRQLEPAHRGIIDEAKDLADLPVGSMDEAEWHCLNGSPYVRSDCLDFMEHMSQMQDIAS